MKQDNSTLSATAVADRRSFLKLAGLGTVGTVAAAASTVTATAAAGGSPAPQAVMPVGGPGPTAATLLVDRRAWEWAR